MTQDMKPGRRHKGQRYRVVDLSRDLARLSGRDALQKLGVAIDECTLPTDLPELEQATTVALGVLPKLTDTVEQAEYHYFLGNAWEKLRVLRDGATKGLPWNEPDLVRANREYRTALLSDGFQRLDRLLQCRLLTNLGNHFDRLGRVVEALDFWNHALALDPGFGMAAGCHALALRRYARYLSHGCDARAFLEVGRRELQEALQRPLEGNAEECFRTCLEQINGVLDKTDRPADCGRSAPKLGRTKAERAYRRACAHERLFLNPLNDLGSDDSAAYDPLMLPPLAVKLDAGSQIPGLFNQIKQEYVSARYLYFEGSRDRGRPHFSDLHVPLTDTLDYSAYGLTSEQLKLAFRASYSILDKIGFFLNEYLGLGILERDVTFRTLWFKSREPKKGLRADISGSRNLPLCGLYWIARDLSYRPDSEEGSTPCPEPEAKELARIRDHLEHKYLKLHDIGGGEGGRRESREPFSDGLAYSVNLFAFRKKTLKILKLARAAILYLVFAVGQEERRRRVDRDGKPGIRLPIEFDSVRDEFKR